MVQRNKGLNFTIRFKGGSNYSEFYNPVDRSNQLIEEIVEWSWNPTSASVPPLYWYEEGEVSMSVLTGKLVRWNNNMDANTYLSQANALTNPESGSINGLVVVNISGAKNTNGGSIMTSPFATTQNWNDSRDSYKFFLLRCHNKVSGAITRIHGDYNTPGGSIRCHELYITKSTTSPADSYRLKTFFAQTSWNPFTARPEDNGQAWLSNDLLFDQWYVVSMMFSGNSTDDDQRVWLRVDGVVNGSRLGSYVFSGNGASEGRQSLGSIENVGGVKGFSGSVCEYFAFSQSITSQDISDAETYLTNIKATLEA